MACEQFQELISAYLDDELSSKENALITEHFKQCPKCSNDLEQLKSTLDLLHTIRPVDTPEGFKDSVIAEIQKMSRGGNKKKFITRSSWFSWAAAATVMIVVVSFVGLSILGKFDKKDYNMAVVEETNPGEQLFAKIESAPEIAADRGNAEPRMFSATKGAMPESATIQKVALDLAVNDKEQLFSELELMDTFVVDDSATFVITDKSIDEILELIKDQGEILIEAVDDGDYLQEMVSLQNHYDALNKSMEQGNEDKGYLRHEFDLVEWKLQKLREHGASQVKIYEISIIEK